MLLAESSQQQQQMKVLFIKKSSNKKVGSLPVTITEAASCPKTCPHINGNCYGKTGPQSWIWAKVNKGTAGKNLSGWDEFCKKISALPAGQPWRHNTTGDLFHVDGLIRLDLLKKLIDANRGKRGWTYSHHLLNTHNTEALKYATNNEFTINASCETLEQSDKALNKGLNAACIVSSNRPELIPFSSLKDKRTYYRQTAPIKTPQGRRLVICPAQKSDSQACKTCLLCSKQSKGKWAVGFVAHGNNKKKLEQLLNQST